MSNLTVQLPLGGILDGNVLTLAHTTITGDVASVGFFAPAAIRQSEVVLDKMSFIGASDERNGSLLVATDTLRNNGTVAGEAGGTGEPALTVAPLSVAGRAAFINNGHLILSNGGDGVLSNTDVTGTGNIAVSDASTLTLTQSTIAASQKLDMGGEDATTLAFQPGQSTVLATIAGFGITDFIDLEEFLGTITVSGTKNPLLHLAGGVGGGGTPVSFDLALKGNFKGDTFSLSSDDSGGSLLMVNQT